MSLFPSDDDGTLSLLFNLTLERKIRLLCTINPVVTLHLSIAVSRLAGSQSAELATVVFAAAKLI